MRFPTNLKILLSREPTDMRKSINGLSILVSERLKKNPTDLYVFVFRNKRGDKLKILYWDRNGFCLWYKIIQKGRFRFPKKLAGIIELSMEQLQWLLDELDFSKLKGFLSKKYDIFF